MEYWVGSIEKKKDKALQQYGHYNYVYLRIGIEVGNIAEAGILEIWPKGNGSRVHAHAGCAGAIRVARGSLNVYIYPSLDSTVPPRTVVLNENDITWLTQRHNFVHRVEANNNYFYGNQHEFCASFHLYKNCQDEFFATQEKGILQKWVPQNDIEPSEWGVCSQQIWTNYVNTKPPGFFSQGHFLQNLCDDFCKMETLGHSN